MSEGDPPNELDLLDLLEALAKDRIGDDSMSISPHTALWLISGYRERLNLRSLLAESAQREADAHNHVARLERRIEQLS